MKEEIIDVQWELVSTSISIPFHYIVNWFILTMILPFYIIKYLYF